jgi:hypothetical protein
MTAPRRRRTEPSPVDLDNVRTRQRGRDAIARIIAMEAALDDLSGPELRFVVSMLEWFAGMPVKDGGR